VGDYFYIVLQGEVEILKASKHYIHDLDPADWSPQAKAVRNQAYIDAFLDNYNSIFWPFMDIKQHEFDEMFGLNKNVSIDEIRIRGIKASRQFEDFIMFREKNQQEFVENGFFFIYV